MGLRVRAWVSPFVWAHNAAQWLRGAVVAWSRYCPVTLQGGGGLATKGGKIATMPTAKTALPSCLNVGILWGGTAALPAPPPLQWTPCAP